MHSFFDALRLRSQLPKSGCFLPAGFSVLLVAALSASAFAQSPAPQQPPATTQAPAQPATTPDAPAAAQPTDSASTGKQPAIDKNPTITAGAFSLPTTGGEIKEDQLKQLLVGKTLYLRAGYQDNNLEFDEQGHLTSHSPKGSFTLSQIQVNKVKLSKHKLELEGDRYALHFLGAAPYEDPTKATDRVKITPKKKTVRISFAREQVEIPKKKKDKNKDKDKRKHDDHVRVAANGSAGSPAAGTASDPSLQQTSSAAYRSSDDKGTKTTSPAHASQLLLTALDNVFSRGIDDRMIASLPDFWKIYFQAAQAKAEIKPVEGSGVFTQGNVDQKAKLVSALDPPSNEFAQANGVAGIAMYHALIGSDGKVVQVVAGRPIGFGLDESAEQTIRKAVFQPAMKDGKPVPVALDLVVSFRIYSKRTSEPAPEDSAAAAEKSDKPALPGPYTLQAEEAQARSAQQTQPAAQQKPSSQPPTSAQPAAEPPQPSPSAPTPQQSQAAPAHPAPSSGQTPQ